MYPARSVIFFTAVSGAGYGVWTWLAVAVLTGTVSSVAVMGGLVAGAVLVTAGLMSSTLHLHHPLRAWRALTQWRSSGLSREAVAAIATYLPPLAWLVQLAAGRDAGAPVALALAFGSLMTVVCTGMIYATLKAIARWHHPLVVPLYLGFALVSGGTAWAAIWHALGAPPQWLGPVLIVLAAATWLGKIAYWRGTDAHPVAGSVNTATGLHGDVRVFDPPHTEPNYLLSEMGFVVARRRAVALRRVALSLGLGVAPAALVVAIALPRNAEAAAAIAAAATFLAVLAERWLFFAQARHSLSHYYGVAGAQARN